MTQVSSDQFTRCNDGDVFRREFYQVDLVRVLISRYAPQAFRFRRIRPHSVFRGFFFNRRPSNACKMRVLPLITNVYRDQEAITTRQAIRRVFAFVIMSSAYRRECNNTLPLYASINNNDRITSTSRPFVKVIQGRRSSTLSTKDVRSTRQVVVNYRTNNNDRIVYAINGAILMDRRVIALGLNFILLILTRFYFSISRHDGIPNRNYIVCLSGQFMDPTIVNNVIRERRYLGDRILRRVCFAVSTSEYPMVSHANDINARVSICRQVVRLYFLRFQRQDV